uniref:beta-hexosaminidase-like isoform X1 n=1 Tax=Styela clava TaxID=7725 RepID=UPI0019397400|nr:beta-hexosaminidase-like isoform X1 [Styela clava]
MKRAFCTVVALLLLITNGVSSQTVIDYVASNLEIKYEVISNLVGGFSNFTARISLTNLGNQQISSNGWELYFMNIYMIQPDQELWKTTDGYEIPDSNFRVYHINGCVFKFVPTQNFAGIPAKSSAVINLVIQNWSVARTDMLPNWWVATSDGEQYKTIESTATEQLETFTGDFTTPEQWKRYEEDQFDPWTPSIRWDRNNVADLGSPQKLVIPTPITTTSTSGAKIPKPLSGWQIVNLNNSILNEANMLGEKLNLEVVDTLPVSNEMYVTLVIKTSIEDDESYILNIDGDSKTIEISAKSPAGIYYGCQTLISVVETNSEKEISSMRIEDSPRYKHRGMHVDVARHFVPYNDMVKLIKVMGMYKLNKLHFHLTDDEGWRVEMSWCSYLTTVGATQCFDSTEQSCIIPQFGSRPDGTDRGSGFYTIEQYKDLLRLANSHHIEVIPEVDMPGHARAAIKATQAYLQAARDKEIEVSVTEAEEIQISEPNDPSQYISVQMYTDNAINPCLESTYNFVEKTVQSFIDYHRDIQPLRVMHLGGDEVASGAWLESNACQDLINSGILDLKEHFVRKISEIVKNIDENLTLGLWEDGAMTENEMPFNRTENGTKEVLVNAWQNIWEWGLADRAYKLANAGYKVVMSQATHLYFDHPEEPDPEERGFYWATRFASTKKTFGFKPDDLYSNVDTTRAGKPLTEDDICKCDFCECTPLEIPENIIGIQGQIWTETMRNSREFFEAVFPRLIALAERAWHKASWESGSTDDSFADDWKEFANTVGYKEFSRLEQNGILYRVPVPGAKIEGSLIQLNSEFPGLDIIYSTSDNPHRWSKYTVPFAYTNETYLQVRSADGSRGGRIVSVKLPSSGTKLQADNIFIVLVLLVLSFIVF